MFLVKKATKPLGIGSIIKVSKENLNKYYTKKSGAYNDRLTDQKYIVLGKVNSCDQKIIRVINVFTGSYQQGNTNYFIGRKKARLTFLALSVIEDTKQSYTSIFGDIGRLDVQDKLLKVHGICITKV
jgi:hypothetical protein